MAEHNIIGEHRALQMIPVSTTSDLTVIQDIRTSRVADKA